VRHVRGLILAALVPGAAAADAPCEDLWLAEAVTRLQTGACLTSPRAETVFGVWACALEVAPSAPAPARLAQIADWAEVYNCDLDAVGADPAPLRVRDITRRLALEVQPIRGDTEHGCVGWRGAVLDLRSAPSGDARSIGRLRPGDSFGLVYLPEPGDWEYIQVSAPGPGLIAAGWVRIPAIFGDLCDMAAG